RTAGLHPGRALPLRAARAGPRRLVPHPLRTLRKSKRSARPATSPAELSTGHDSTGTVTPSRDSKKERRPEEAGMGKPARARRDKERRVAGRHHEDREELVR